MNARDFMSTHETENHWAAQSPFWVWIVFDYTSESWPALAPLKELLEDGQLSTLNVMVQIAARCVPTRPAYIERREISKSSASLVK